MLKALLLFGTKHHLTFCSQTDVQEAVPRWGREEEGGKNSKLVLVSLLLTGLLLAALLVAGYYFKTHRRTSKGIRLVSGLEEVCHSDNAD